MRKLTLKTVLGVDCNNLRKRCLEFDSGSGRRYGEEGRNGVERCIRTITKSHLSNDFKKIYTYIYELNLDIYI